MGLRDAVEVTLDNAKNMVVNPRNQIKRATSALAESTMSDGMVGVTAKTLGDRKSRMDSIIDGTNDPTRVEYGGNRGSSTGQ